MVYETDFYTVRRPYSRPTITSYSVTAPRLGVSTWKVKPSIRTSVLIGELDRIYHRPRPHLGYAPLEDYLNSRPHVEFDDETRLIRAETERLMRRIYTSVPHPRSSSPLPVTSYHHGCYSDKKPNSYGTHYNTMVDDILSMSYYSEPTARSIGRGHLACVSFAGGRGYPRRRHLYSDENRDIGDEIRTRSYYHNNYNKAYVDAMSLPTGFASYLLRIKPPEKNESSLTNLEKMHIIALSEERKKNAKKTKPDEEVVKSRYSDISEHKSALTNGFSSPIMQDVIKPSKNSKLSRTEDEYVPTEPDVEIKKELPVGEVNGVETILNSKLDLKDNETEIPSSKRRSVTELQSQKSFESSKPEKKSKSKKGSLNKTPSISDTIAPVQDEIKISSEDIASIGATPGNVESNQILETTVSQDLTTNEEPVQSDTLECKPEKMEQSISEPILAEPEPVEQPVLDTAKVESSSLETNSAQIAESDTKTPETEMVPTQEVIPESSAAEYEEVSSNDKQDILKEENIETSVPTEQTENEELKSSESVNPPVDEDAVSVTKIHPSESSEIVEEINLENQTDQAAREEEKEPLGELIESISGNLTEAEIQGSVDTITTTVTTSVIQESVTSTIQETVTSEIQSTTTEINQTSTEENEIGRKGEEAENSLKLSESTDIQNVIEEVTDLGSNEIQKENETEPLIEEPQSPSDCPENLPEKATSNEICEVLSDVPEES